MMNPKLLVLSLLLFCLNAPLQALESATVRRVMKQMEQDLLKAQKAMLHSKPKQLLQAAEALTDPPQPSLLESLRILSRVGSKIPQFKAWNEKVKQAAVRLLQAVKEKDVATQAQAYGQILQGCMGCHEQFIKPAKSPP